MSMQNRPGNPDMKYPPNNNGQQAVPCSRPGAGKNGGPLIDKWAEAPASGTYVLAAIDGEVQWIETEECN